MPESKALKAGRIEYTTSSDGKRRKGRYIQENFDANDKRFMTCLDI